MMKQESIADRLRRKMFRWYLCLKKDRCFLLYGIVISVFMFGSELIHSPVGVDDDLFLTRAEYDQFWCTQGRFIPYLFLKILHQYPFIPYFSLLSSLLLSLLAFEIIFYTRDRSLNYLKYLTYPIFAGCSTLSHTYGFLCLASITGWGFFFSAVSWYCLKRKSVAAKGFSVVCGAAALGCYQIFIAFLASLQIFDMLRQNNQKRLRIKEFFAKTLSALGYLVSVYAVYFLSCKLILAILGAKPDEYIDGLISGFPNSVGHLLEGMRRIFGNLRLFFCGDKMFFTENTVQLSLFILICLSVITIVRIWKDVCKGQADVKKYAIDLLLWIPLFLLPFIVPFMTMGEQFPVRTFITFPFLLTLLLYFAWEYSGGRWKVILTFSALLLSVKFCALNARMTHICRLREQEDARVMDHIRFRLLEQIKGGKTMNIPLVTAGNYVPAYLPGNPYPGFGSQHIGTSAASWRGTIPRRFTAFMQSQMILNFVPAEKKHCEKIMPYLRKMPSYPAPGSIRMIDGIAVVKFGPLMNSQLEHYGISVPTYGIKELDEVPAGAVMIWEGTRKNIQLSPHIRAEEKDHFSELKITGNNPMISLTDLPSGQDAVLCLKFTSDWNDAMELFFRRKSSNGKVLPGCKIEKEFRYGENQVILFISGDILAANPVLRIDPGRGKAKKIRLQKAALYTVTKEEK